MKKLLFIFPLLFLLFNSYAQDSVYLRKNAIKIDNTDSLNNYVYDAVSSYKLIMIGEMHGTNEPSRLIISLAKLLVKNNDSVQIGLEISSDQMKTYLSNPIDSNVYKSDFFARNYMDARGCFAWAGIILKLKSIPKIEIFFYDINSDDSIYDNARDSLMYVKIKRRILSHPSWKTITLSGNLHNMLLPKDNKIKMGLYLKNDNELNISDKILSLSHVYETGLLWTNEDNVMKLYQVNHSNSFFAKTVDYESYLYLYPAGKMMNYNGVYFTRKVTPSNLVIKY